jgi:hypothetical protein
MTIADLSGKLQYCVAILYQFAKRLIFRLWVERPSTFADKWRLPRTTPLQILTKKVTVFSLDLYNTV